MKLILVRHGETEDNLAGITQGQHDSKLTERGWEQAKKVALRLKKEQIDACYSSDLNRCVNTAKEILKYHPQVKLILTKELRENFKGRYEGGLRIKTREAINAAESRGVPYHLWDYDGGESIMECVKRFLKFINSIYSQHARDTVLLVSHGGPITGLLAMIHQDDYAHMPDYHPTHTAVTTLSYNGKNFSVKKINCCEHL